jgi:hypothetical protein
MKNACHKLFLSHAIIENILQSSWSFTDSDAICDFITTVQEHNVSVLITSVILPRAVCEFFKREFVVS